MQPIDLSGQVAIVTGSGRGLGLAFAQALAKAGAAVVVNDVDGATAEAAVQSITAAGGRAVAEVVAVGSAEAADRLVARAVESFRRLDILCSNAGILRDRVLVNMMEEEWDAVINVHLKGTFAPSRHAAAYWRNRSKEIDGPVHARIINTSSVSGIYGNTGQTNYGAAKAGIAAFTVIAARELKRYGITVNAVAPQAMTRMTLGLRERTEAEVEAGHPRRVSPAIVWIASTESKDFTGRIVEAGAGLLALSEGWHRGPTAEPIEDPALLGPTMMDLQARARKNAGMNGQDLD